MRTKKVTVNSNGDAKDLLLAESIVRNAPRIGRSRKMIADIPLSLLRIDDSYQRTISNNVKRLMLNWDESKCTALIVSYRDGYFWIVDGQHRFLVAQKLGLSHLVCEVFLGLNVEDEARIFASQNENITRLTPFDTFKANLVFNEKVDTDIKKVCDKYNIVVKKSTASKTLKSVTSARSVVRGEGATALSWIFDVIIKSNWSDFKESFSGDWIESLYYVYQNNKDHLKSVKMNLEKTFKNSSPSQIVSYGNMKNPTLGRRARLKVILNSIANGECNSKDMQLAFAS